VIFQQTKQNFQFPCFTIIFPPPKHKTKQKKIQ